MDSYKTKKERDVPFLSVQLHPTEDALIINYKAEGHCLGQLGRTKLEESQESKKIIEIKGLNDKSDIETLSKYITETCGIPPSKENEVTSLLYLMQQRKKETQTHLSDANDYYDGCGGESGVSGRTLSEVAESAALESYIEMLYEGTAEKVKASKLILQLARNDRNLLILSENDALFSALSQVFNEDLTTSLDLGINIVCTFSCFSRYRQFHRLLAQHKIGALCLEKTESELQRCEKWKNDISEKQELLSQKNLNPFTAKELKRKLQKYRQLIKKQDRFLEECLQILTRVSEDPKLEAKMIKQGIIGMLEKCLRRDRIELVVTSAEFLETILPGLENTDECIKNNIIETLGCLIPHVHPHLMLASLRIIASLVNTDPVFKDLVVKADILPKLINYLPVDLYQDVLLCIMYHVSENMPSSELIIFINCVPFVMKEIIQKHGYNFALHLVSFASVLAKNKKIALKICAENFFGPLIIRGMRAKCCNIMGIIRNLSEHDEIKDEFVVYADELCQVIANEQPGYDDFILQCLGVLGNLAIPQIDYSYLITKYNLLEYFKKKLLEDIDKNDVIREMIAAIGTLAFEESCAYQILEHGIVKILLEIILEKRNNDDIVLQITYLFFKLIYHPSTRDLVARYSQIPNLLAYLLHDKNVKIRRYASACIRILSLRYEELAREIQEQWLQAHYIFNEAGDFNLHRAYSRERFEMFFTDVSSSSCTLEALPECEVSENSPEPNNT